MPELFEAKVQFEVVEPGDLRIDFFALQFGRQVFIVLAQGRWVGRIIVGDDNRIVLHAHIAIQPAEEVLGQMGRLPMGKRRAEALAELLRRRLGQQRHGHVPVANVQVERARPLPAQSLVEIEEFLDMPPLRKVDAQVGNLGAVSSDQERFIIELSGTLARALGDFKVGTVGGVAPAERPFGGGKARPMPGELILRQLLALLPPGFMIGHRDQQIKGRLAADLFDQLAIEVLAIGHHERRSAVRLENSLSQAQQFGGGLGHGAGGTAAGKTNRLAGMGVQAEKRLGHLDRFESGIVAGNGPFGAGSNS